MTEQVDAVWSGQLDDRVAVVTGGARGIGKAAAQGLAYAGADVVILDREADEAAQVCGELQAIGRRADHLRIDLSELHEIPPAVSSILASFGHIDILVNCAGVQGGGGTILDLDVETWEHTHRVDLTAAFS